MPVCHAGTWNVEQNGSGDFTVIQDAVNAAAAGDTILIGPGWYQEATSVLIPLWPQPTDIFVNVTKENLTFIGSDVDEVIIGPEESYLTFYGPQGFGGATLLEPFEIRNVTLRNVRDGVYMIGGGWVSGCKFISMVSHGVLSMEGAGANIDSCYFEWAEAGVSFSLSTGGEVRDCIFYKSRALVLDASDVLFENCRFEGGWPGIKFDGGQGTVNDCTLNGEGEIGAYGVIGINGAEVVVSECEIIEYQFPLKSRNVSTVSASECLLTVGAGAIVYVSTGATATIQGSDIYKTGDWYVQCAYYEGEPIALDLGGNYWGGASLEEVEAGILDSSVDPDVHYTVIVEPISDVPLPAEKKSMGGFKSLFR